MAIRFEVVFGMNGRSGNWLALPALPTGMDPMRNVILSCAADFMVGHCTAGAAADNAGFLYCAAGRHNLGVVDYTKITVRNTATSGTSMFVYHFAATDQFPEGAG